MPNLVLVRHVTVISLSYPTIGLSMAIIVLSTDRNDEQTHKLITMCIKWNCVN